MGEEEEPFAAEAQLALSTVEEQEPKGTTPLDLARGNEKVRRLQYDIRILDCRSCNRTCKKYVLV